MDQSVEFLQLHATKFAALAAVAIAARLIAGRRTARKTTQRLRSATIGSTTLMNADGGSCGAASKLCDPIINIVAWFNKLPLEAKVAEIWRTKMVPHRRFHCSPINTPNGIMWVTKNVVVEDHIYSHLAASEAEMKSIIERVSNQPLHDAKRPLWELHFIESSDKANTPSAIVFRIHHVIGDGISLMEVFCDALTASPTGPALDIKDVFQPRHMRSSRPSLLARAAKLPLMALSFVWCTIKVLGIAKGKHDSQTSYFDYSKNTVYSGSHKVVYFPTHSLELVKKIKTLAGKGITVNDVEFGLFGGAIRRLIEFNGGNPKGVCHRALTPFAMPSPTPDAVKYHSTLRNMFTFLTNELPVQQDTPKKRLLASHGAWNAIKTSMTVPAAFFVHKTAGSILPMAEQQNTAHQLMMRHSVVFSNTPGVQQQIFFAGEPVVRTHMVFHNMIPQVGIIGMNGELTMALTIDGATTPNADKLPQFFLDELKELAMEVGVPKDELAAELNRFK